MPATIHPYIHPNVRMSSPLCLGVPSAYDGEGSRIPNGGADIRSDSEPGVIKQCAYRKDSVGHPQADKLKMIQS
jgi:hypothetical protein